MSAQFPFSAVVGATPDERFQAAGMADMALALVLTTISPEVGGVLVRGEKGTAKSTLVRALANVLPPIDVIAGDRFSVDPAHTATSPDAPFADATVETRPVRLVELPVGATEDRVLGSLHLSRALSEGKAEYDPGLLARAHRGVLYVDEVNLLHDHLVDVLLDAAAMGRSTVERDGVSIAHPARFVLVGTMNPEEGELRPQLLDRFGLTVEIAAPRDPSTRAEVVRRRMAFEQDPAGFAEAWQPAEKALTERLVAAQSVLPRVVVTDDALLRIARVCAGFEVDGLRADIVTARAAVAHAAWEGRTHLTRADIRAAARLALPHRRRRNPFDAPGLDEDLLDQLLGDDEVPPPPDDDPTPDGGGTDDAPGRSSDGPAEGASGGPKEGPVGQEPHLSGGAPADQGGNPRPAGDARSDARHSAGDPFRVQLHAVAGTGAGEAGKRSRARTTTGRRVGATAGTGAGLHLAETIRAAAPHQLGRGRRDRILFEESDLRSAVREGKEANLVLFCVDASGSMAARKRMQQVKTAILSLLVDAYQRRDKVGLVTFRGDSAEENLPPTSSVDIAATRLDELPSGGRTPLAEGLLRAADVLRRERLRDPRRRALLVVLTDGRATSGAGALERTQQAAAFLAEQLHGTGRAPAASALVIDCEAGPLHLGLARALAGRLGAQHLPLAEVSAAALTDVVRQNGAA